MESLLLKAIQEDLFTEEGLEIFKAEFERFLIQQRQARATNKDEAQTRLADVERGIYNITMAIKAGIMTSTTKEMLTQAEAEREKLRQILHVPTYKLDKIMTVLPNQVERFRRMLHDLARATRYEIDKAREIVFGLVGEKKIVLYPTEDQRGRYFTAELEGDYTELIPLVFSGELVVAVGRIERPTRGL